MDPIAKYSGKALDVEAASTANGARIQQWGYRGGDNQRWNLQPASPAQASFVTSPVLKGARWKGLAAKVGAGV